MVHRRELLTLQELLTHDFLKRFLQWDRNSFGGGKKRRGKEEVDAKAT